MAGETYFAGIDGGGTKTEAVLVDHEAREVARVRSSTSNAAAVGHEVAIATLEQCLRDLAEEGGTQLPLAGAWFGLSGSDRPEDHAQLRPPLERLVRSVMLTNDGELVLAGVPDRIGVALVSGTGSIAIGRNAEGKTARAGGWGHIIGDEGSGYGITRDMLIAIAAAHDGRGPETSLMRRLLELWGMTDPFSLIQRVYAQTTSKGDLAALSQLVIEEARAGDAVAIGIIDKAAEDLASFASAVARRLGFVDRFSLAVTGGLLTNIGEIREGVLARLNQHFTVGEPAVVRDAALMAAIAAREQFGTKA